jgi:hypothetical protein
MSYFQYFPTTLYTAQNGNVYDIVDITKRIAFFERYRQNDQYTSDYLVQEGESPQSLAQDFYNDPELDWVLLSLNKVIDPFYDWVMSSNVFEEYLDNKYPIGSTYIGGPDTNYLWVLPDGRFFPYNQNGPDTQVGNSVDLDATGLSNFAFRITYRQYENDKNEARRMIRVVQPTLVSSIVTEFKLEMKSMIALQA